MTQKVDNKEILKVVKTLSDDNKGIKDSIKTLSDDNKGIKDSIKTLSDDNKGIKDSIKTLSDDNKGVKDSIKTLSDEKKEILEAINVMSTANDKRFTNIESDVGSIKSTMVTKHYLDEKLADLRGDLVVLVRKEDVKVKKLVDILKNRKLINDKEVEEIMSMEPFPQLSL